MPPNVPLWIRALPADEQELQTRIFYIKFAALCATPSGNLARLSSRLGRNSSYLSFIITPGRGPIRALVTPEDCIKIETMLGREVMPRELLRPDVFLVPPAP